MARNHRGGNPQIRSGYRQQSSRRRCSHINPFYTSLANNFSCGVCAHVVLGRAVSVWAAPRFPLAPSKQWWHWKVGCSSARGSARIFSGGRAGGSYLSWSSYNFMAQKGLVAATAGTVPGSAEGPARTWTPTSPVVTWGCFGAWRLVVGGRWLWSCCSEEKTPACHLHGWCRLQTLSGRELAGARSHPRL